MYTSSHIDDQEPNPESLISRSVIMEFYSETAKLKSLGVLHKVRTHHLFVIFSISVEQKSKAWLTPFVVPWFVEPEDIATVFYFLKYFAF